MSRAGLDKNPREVAEMFGGVARHYDWANTVMCFGLDRYWRRAAHQALRLTPQDCVLDLAAGTGISTVELSRSGARCIAADFSTGMLFRGRELGRDVPMVGADGMLLPFKDESFDAVTVCFGLRNMQDTAAALSEMARVTRPGGRLVICEFSTPVWRPFRTVYRNYVPRALPVLAKGVSSNPEAYVYLAESIRSWPDQRSLADTIARSGWSRVGWRNLTNGIVTLHRATKPA
ncbi:demethylmenaquinone methyltransferase [Kitasatospora sp. CM 4170]|uniref:Demethylmenaquinone methyltransferase n=1 Tax=Kitasatospora aburaviensis TaxID=67265 RepID=A0ABW1EY54_9ACTN|nr:demethylmenaquinone methyltransferase [Kitasatospora sp. CM 4170]WNM44324.1 demethylmenaquinone methyltransferase [Kitasatospora sp. CM 4170]